MIKPSRLILSFTRGYQSAWQFYERYVQQIRFSADNNSLTISGEDDDSNSNASEIVRPRDYAGATFEWV